MQAEYDNAATELFGQLRDYVYLQAKIARLRVIKQVAGKSASALAVVIFLVLSVTIFGILTVSAGLYLSTLFHDTALGFLVLGAFYVLILVLLIIFREPLIKRPLRNTIIRSLLKS